MKSTLVPLFGSPAPPATWPSHSEQGCQSSGPWNGISWPFPSALCWVSHFAMLCPQSPLLMTAERHVWNQSIMSGITVQDFKCHCSEEITWSLSLIKKKKHRIAFFIFLNFKIFDIINGRLYSNTHEASLSGRKIFVCSAGMEAEIFIRQSLNSPFH